MIHKLNYSRFVEILKTIRASMCSELETIQLYQLCAEKKETYADFLHRIGLRAAEPKPKELTDEQKARQLKNMTIIMGGDIK